MDLFYRIPWDKLPKLLFWYFARDLGTEKALRILLGLINIDLHNLTDILVNIALTLHSGVFDQKSGHLRQMTNPKISEYKVSLWAILGTLETF